MLREYGHFRKSLKNTLSDTHWPRLPGKDLWSYPHNAPTTAEPPPSLLLLPSPAAGSEWGEWSSVSICKT